MLKQNKILIAIILVGLFSSLALVATRYRSESRNRAVELVVDWDQIRAVSLATGASTDSILHSFKEVGVSGVAVTEQTLTQLRDAGQIQVQASPGSARIRTPDSKLERRIYTYLIGKYGTRVIRQVSPGELELRVSFEQIRDIGVGLPEEDVRKLQSAPYSLDVIGRLQNFPAATPQSIEWDLGHVSSLGIQKVIFAADQVLGFSGLTGATADSLIRHGMIYGPIEFGKQKGDDKLSEKLKGRNMIRVHSVGAAELWTLTPATAVERYVRAARERNIRMLYVRLFDGAHDRPIAAHRDYLSAIVHGLNRSGLSVDNSHPFQRPARPLALLLLSAFGVVAGFMLLLSLVFPVSARSRCLLSILGMLFAAALVAKTGSMGIRLLALLAALTYPTLAFVLIRIRAGEPRPLGVGTALAAIPIFLAMSAVTLIGAITVAGILADLPFMLHVSQFLGIKAAHLLPILAVLAIYMGDMVNRGENWDEYLKRVKANFAAFFSQPILIWQLLITGMVLIIFALLLMRTGNDAGVGVSPMELKFRAILDRIMFVRPRSKEFGFGHPALLIGITMAIAGRKRWIAPFVIAGSVGQVSLLNTFCHIHSPLALSILRAMNGIIVGLLIGIAIIWIWSRFSRTPGHSDGQARTTIAGGAPRG